ncbi:MAG: glycosyltransferase family 2 protein, partial [Acidobacteriota bacterium]
MPCLNEADTVVVCVQKALRGLAAAGATGEVILADNGSTDGSQALAEAAGARVVAVPEKGYGSALMGGIAAARGRFVIMGDADDSYDFQAIPQFVEKLRQGYDLVMGCRLPPGGGAIVPGAMPVLHRLIGNPLFTFMVRKMFGAPINDVYCGLRGFSREFYRGLNMRCTGMEFATEMVIKASLFAGRIAETPITLHPDGRKQHPPHLKTFRDGWRTLRFFLMLCPRWLYLIPGCALMLLGLLGFLLILPGFTLFGLAVDLHSLLVCALALLLGSQTIQFGILTKLFAVGEGLLPETPEIARFLAVFRLERTLLAGAGTLLVGLLLIAVVAWQWWRLS